MKGDSGDLKKLFKEVPLFRALMHNSMMSLSKCYFELDQLYEGGQRVRGFLEDLVSRSILLSKEMLLLISGYDMLMENEAISRESIKIRENIVLPLLVIQQYALQRIGQKSEHTELYEKIVTRSLYGNINASRNSA